MTDPGLKLFVTHLPEDWTEKTVKDYFQTYGSVSYVELFSDKLGSKAI
jgi:RNA recognition motif-containing protein